MLSPFRLQQHSAELTLIPGTPLCSAGSAEKVPPREHWGRSLGHCRGMRWYFKVRAIVSKSHPKWLKWCGFKEKQPLELWAPVDLATLLWLAEFNKNKRADGVVLLFPQQMGQRSAPGLALTSAGKQHCTSASPSPVLVCQHFISLPLQWHFPSTGKSSRHTTSYHGTAGLVCALWAEKASCRFLQDSPR